MEEPKSVRIHPTAEVSPQARVGVGTVIWNNAQVREDAVIGLNCSLGKDVYIDVGVHVGSGVKIQNGVSVFRGVTVDDDVFLGPHMTFTNDLHPRAFNDDWQVVSTRVRKGASIGANATVLCGVTIGEYAFVAAGSLVSRDVPAHVLVRGNPARAVGYVCRCGHKVADLSAGETIEDLRGTFTCTQCGLGLTR